MNNRIRVLENCIQIINLFEGDVIYTIWADDFNVFRDAFEKSEDYHKELESLREKYEAR